MKDNSRHPAWLTQIYKLVTDNQSRKQLQENVDKIFI